MASGTYNYIVTGAYKPTYNWGAHIVYYISHLYPSRHITMILQ